MCALWNALIFQSVLYATLRAMTSERQPWEYQRNQTNNGINVIIATLSKTIVATVGFKAIVAEN
jgi:hypothetical protein